jgi:small-conductance mechanosensitive channel
MVNITAASTFLKRSSSLFLLGEQVVPDMMRKFTMSRSDLRAIYELIWDATHPADLLVLIIIGWLLVPVFGNLFYANKKKPFRETYRFQLLDHVSQLAKLSLIVYLVEMIVVVLLALGFNYANMSKLSQVFAKILFVGWMAQRISVFKRYLLGQAVSRAPDKLGKASLVDKLVDGFLFALLILFLLDILNVEMGIGITSVFAFGSAGTLVMGLAMKDVAAMFVQGMAMTTADRMHEGDAVQFGDGTSGVIVDIGWMQTTIRNFDELIEVVPNSELGMQRVKNLSRVNVCRVLQTLRFRYEDADKLAKVCDDILEEIKSSCNEAITDGSRPFRAHWREYKTGMLRDDDALLYEDAWDCGCCVFVASCTFS